MPQVLDEAGFRRPFKHTRGENWLFLRGVPRQSVVRPGDRRADTHWNMKKKWLIALVVVVVGVLTFLTWRFAFFRTSRDHSVVRVSGNIEVTDAEVSFKIPGRVAQRFVDEGEFVTIGACVAVLETNELSAELAMREAQLQAVQSTLAELEAGSRPEEIKAAKARLASAKADDERAASDFRSAQQLLRKKVISDEEFVLRKGLYEAAAARMREAAEQLKLVQEGPRKEQIDLARARVAEANAALTLAQTQLDYARLTSPLSGVVLSKSIEPGEYVAPGTPVVTVGDLENPWLRAYIDETDLGRVQLGQKVLVSTDTYPGKKCEGVLSFIASQAEFTPKNVETRKERVKLVYRIKVTIPNPNLELKPGMPADAEILLNSAPPHHAGH
jgi:membrane fusion protein YbhG